MTTTDYPPAAGNPLGEHPYPADHQMATAQRHSDALHDAGIYSAMVAPSDADGFVIGLDRADADRLTEIMREAAR